MSATERCIETFGLTNNPEDAGYILPDGRMLDFKRSKRSGWLDHYDIEKCLLSLDVREHPDAVDMPPIYAMRDLGMLQVDFSDGRCVIRGVGGVPYTNLQAIPVTKMCKEGFHFDVHRPANGRFCEWNEGKWHDFKAAVERCRVK